MHAEFRLRSWHEILATGCLRAPAMASTLFSEEAYRAAFYFDLEEDLVFLPELFVELWLVFFELDELEE
jgi:hypothetical protein